MKLILKTNRERSLKNFAYGLIATMGIVFAFSSLAPSVTLVIIALVLTGSLI